MSFGIISQHDCNNVDINYAVIVIQDPLTGAVMLTKRASHMRKHAGEFCFPGGKREDGETVTTTALRELYEEIGVTISDIHLVHRPDLPQAATTYTSSLTFGVVYAHLRIPRDEFTSRLNLNTDEVELVKWFDIDNYELIYNDDTSGMIKIVDMDDASEVIGATADVLFAVFENYRNQ